MEGLVIERLKKEEIKDCVPIYIKEYSKEPYNEKWSEEIAMRSFEQSWNEDLCFVAKVNEKIAGFLFASIFPWESGEKSWAHEIVVDSEFQGKGVGEALWERYEEELKKKGIHHIEAMASLDAPAWKFHQKHGFKEARYKLIKKEL